jgi:hypothetical protein
MSVHQKCYGILIIPSSDWICDLCTVNGKEAKTTKCLLCSVVGGAMKTSFKKTNINYKIINRIKNTNGTDILIENIIQDEMKNEIKEDEETEAEAEVCNVSQINSKSENLSKEK